MTKSHNGLMTESSFSVVKRVWLNADC